MNDDREDHDPAGDPDEPYQAPEPSADADQDAVGVPVASPQPHLALTPVEITGDHEDDPEDPTGDPTWKIIGVISMVTVVAAGAIVVFLLITGRGGTPEPGVLAPPVATPTSETITQTPRVTEAPATPTTKTTPTTESPTTTTTEETTERTSETRAPEPTIPSSRKVTEWAKVTTGLSPTGPFSAAPDDTWMHSVTGVSVDGTKMIVEMNADASIDVPAGEAAASYYAAVLSGASNDSWESLVTEVIALDSSGTPMSAVPTRS